MLVGTDVCVLGNNMKITRWPIRSSFKCILYELYLFPYRDINNNTNINTNNNTNNNYNNNNDFIFRR